MDRGRRTPAPPDSSRIIDMMTGPSIKNQKPISAPRYSRSSLSKCLRLYFSPFLRIE
ncbi:hypothetical protein K7J14_04715 [Treponema zuelzerae]|uniref:Uncharacterized protein n=1 Tax=Teretinema zuelzerae TaxID=156 RepID=A0AAE3EGZ8_9SPIR|nr:hypothetical protein [Teretinema zuelzerae]MCD1654000.1 hypothetical protein [Teretinema zuelzerae]